MYCDEWRGHLLQCKHSTHQYIKPYATSSTTASTTTANGKVSKGKSKAKRSDGPSATTAASTNAGSTNGASANGEECHERFHWQCAWWAGAYLKTEVCVLF